MVNPEQSDVYGNPEEGYGRAVALELLLRPTLEMKTNETAKHLKPVTEIKSTVTDGAETFEIVIS